MEQTRNIIFRSEFVSISDVSGDEAFFAGAGHNGGGSVLVFVRSGMVARHETHGVTVADANYILAAVDEERLYPIPLAGVPCACTLLRFYKQAGEAPSFRSATYVLATPRAYLMQARLLNAAWLGRSAGVLEASAAEVLSEVFAGEPHARALGGEHADTVHTIRLLVNQALSKPHPLGELARRTFLSPFTVSRIFHQRTGLSLRRYVKRLRLRTALNLMLEGSRTLTEIASELGFYDEAHFSKAFHAEFGIAPALAFGATCNRAERAPKLS